MFRPIQSYQQVDCIQRIQIQYILSQVRKCRVKTQHYPLKLLKMFKIYGNYKFFAFFNNILSFIADKRPYQYLLSSFEGVILVFSVDAVYSVR